MSLKNLHTIVVKGRHGIHIFQDIRTLQWSILKLTELFSNRDSFNLAASKLLFKQLKQCSFDPKWIKKIDNPEFYRRVGPKRDVLDTAGSLSDGGRFNIGGAQSSSQNSKAFLGIGGKRSALYLGQDVTVVRKEYGDFGMNASRAVTFSVRLRRRKYIDLIDVTLAINNLSKSIPNLKDILGADSMNGKWGDLKQPAPSQIFGHWLMNQAPVGTIGIKFPSSHDNKSLNICLYFEDSIACKKLLIAEKILF
jgi:hypothetical protein